MSSKEEIIRDFNAYMANVGGAYHSWYVGISQSPRRRLFREHGVKEKEGSWIYGTVSSSPVAREIEKHFLGLGCDGGAGGGDHDAIGVYIYAKAYNTNP